MKNTVRMARSALDEQFVLADWRILSYSLIAQFVATSFLEARHFVDDVVGAAESLGHHPDIDIRYPGTVRITLTTHAANGLTELDANLAATISELAAKQSIVATPTRVAVLDVAIDALNIAAVIPFWKAVLGYIDEPPANPGDSVDAIMDPLRIGPPFWFQQMDNPRPQRNRTISTSKSLTTSPKNESLKRSLPVGDSSTPMQRERSGYSQTRKATKSASVPGKTVTSRHQTR
jgi:pterin-4a-carbinolamine dehydratase